MADIETILERVRKLHAKAESAREIGSIHEAETFAAVVQKLLESHKLSMSDVELAAQDVEDPMGEGFIDFEGWGLQPKSRREIWALGLASAVARAHYCRCVDFTNITSKQTIQFIGRTSDRMIAEHVFLTLYRSALSLSEKAMKDYKAAGGEENGKSYRVSWLAGFTSEIALRYLALASERAGHMALVRAMNEVNEYTRQLHRRLSSINRSTSVRSMNGREAGREAGRNANINPAKGVGGSWAPRTRQLGSGS